MTKQPKIRFWEEAPGVQSINRLGFIGITIWAIFITTWGAMAMKWTPGEIVAVFSGLAGMAYGGKLIQKAMEEKPQQKEQEP